MIFSTSISINTGTVIKNQELLKFFPDHLKTKQMCNYAVKKLCFTIKYVPEQYKTKNMSSRAILENGGMLKSVPNWYKTQETCIKAIP